jgi:predicted aspartyl protease
MPEVYVDAILKGKSEVKERILLNSGARDAELILPRRVAKKVGVVVKGKVKVFLGREMKGELGFLEVTVQNPETGEKRTRVLETVVLPDRVLDCPLLGIVGQEKLGVTPDTRTGKPIF